MVLMRGRWVRAVPHIETHALRTALFAFVLPCAQVLRELSRHET